MCSSHHFVRPPTVLSTFSPLLNFQLALSICFCANLHVTMFPNSLDPVNYPQTFFFFLFSCCSYFSFSIFFKTQTSRKQAWVFLSSLFLLSLSLSHTHTHAHIMDMHTHQQTNTLTSNLMLGADRTTHTVWHTKCLECYKHLFRLKRRFLCVCVCVCVRLCVRVCVHVSAHFVFAEREGKFNSTCWPPDRRRSNMTKYFGCVVHKTGQVYI